MKRKMLKPYRRKGWLVKLLASITVFATAYSLILPAVTLSAKETYCGLEEHIHSQECAEDCVIEEHEHSLQCESNPEADVEDEATWLASLNGSESMEDSREKLATVAKSQAGYSSSESNFLVSEDGEIIGYNRYGAWNGNPYETDWSADFIKFCLNYANASWTGLDSNDLGQWQTELDGAGLLNHMYTQVELGDLVFFNHEDTLSAGIVTERNNNDILAASKAGNQVEEVRLDLSNEPEISFLNLYEDEVETEAEEADAEEHEVEAYSNEDFVDEDLNDGVMLLAEGDGTDTDTDPEPGTPAVTLPCGFSTEFPADKITYWEIQYKQPSEGLWKTYTEGVKLKYDTQVRLLINYKDLTKTEIANAQGGKYYVSLPDFMKSTETGNGSELEHTEDINSEKLIIGHLKSCDSINHLHVHFDDYEKIKTNTITEGYFYINLATNLEKADQTEKPQITIGGTSKNVVYEDNLLEHYYPTLTYRKDKHNTNKTNVRVDGNKAFIDYEFVIETGDYDLPDVFINDWIGNGSFLIEGYVADSFKLHLGETEKSIPESDYYLNKTLANTSTTKWTGTLSDGKSVNRDVPANGMSVYLGTIPAHTKAKFVYSVEADISALEKGGNYTIRNNAAVYTDNKQRGSDSEDTVLTAGLTLEKHESNIRKDEQGNVLIDYTVVVTAFSGNHFVLKDVILDDQVRIKNSGGTEQTGFTTIDGNFTLENASLTLTSNGTNKSLDATYVEGHNNTVERFRFQLGDMAPGEVAHLAYTLKVDRNVIAKMTAEERQNLAVANRAIVHQNSDRGYADKDERIDLNGWNSNNVSIKYSEMAKKIVADDQFNTQTISMTGENTVVYNADGTVSDQTSFTIPDHSYRYTVTLNPDGVADVTNSVFEDTLSAEGASQDVFTYKGFVKINVFKGAQINGNNPAETLYIKLPERAGSFTFKPGDYPVINDLNKTLQNEYLSYSMQYFVSPVSSGNYGLILDNSFTGTVGIGYDGGSSHQVALNTTVSQWASESSGVTGRKAGLIMLETENETGPYQYGRLLWLVELNGSIIPKGMVFSDTVYAPGGTGSANSHLLSDALVGIYKTSYDFSQEPFNGFTKLKNDGYKHRYTYDDVLNALKDGEVSKDIVTTNLVSIRQMDITFNENLTIGPAEKVYMLIQSTPDNRFLHYDDNRANNVFANKFEYSFHGGDKTEIGRDIMTVRHYNSVLKYWASDFVWDDEKGIQMIDKNTDAKAGLPADQVLSDTLKAVFPLDNPDGLKENTYYIDWLIKANTETKKDDGFNFGGAMDIVEELPADTKFVKAFVVNRTNTGIYYPVTSPTITDTVVSEDGRKVKITVEGVPLKTEFKVHVITEYTGDWNSLISLAGTYGERTSANYMTNRVELFHNGNKIGQAFARRDKHIEGVLSKAGPGSLPGTSLSGGRELKFNINVNDLGVDLIPDGETIDLEDTFNSKIIQINLGSVSVKTADGAAIQGVKTELSDPDENGNQTLRFWGLPDDTPIEISYTATFQLSPGSAAQVKNTVTWKGYGNEAPSRAYDQAYSYNSGGGSLGTTNEYFELTKVDKDNITIKLKDATFEVYECTLPFDENGTKTLLGTYTTGDNGTFEIPSSSTVLYPNRLYMVKETAAPKGFLLNESPHYFYFENTQVGNYTRPESLPVGTSIAYHKEKLELSITNEKPKFNIKIHKTFGKSRAVPGTYTFGIYSKPLPEAGNYVSRKHVTVKDGDNLDELTITFNDVVKDGTYYIYELDPNTGSPMSYGSDFIAAGNTFTVVSKETNGYIVDTSRLEAGDLVEVSIINSPNVSLPMTGGFGTGAYTASGAVIAAAAAAMLIDRKNRKK